MIRFDTFFKAGTGDKTPFEYQCKLACGERKEGESESEWLSHGTKCETTLIKVPTGLGKTEAVIFAWLWNYLVCSNQNNGNRWQTRLVYCLPMRTLVEQTKTRVRDYIKNLREKSNELGLSEDARKKLDWLNETSPIVLMGGEELEDYQKQWDVYPERPCIIVGTQDMLLSRALNRGYGMSVYRWPMHFGLLNVDALWIFDETQLMGVSVETSAQLDAFRKRFGSESLNCKSWWMSATLDDSRLNTIDQRQLGLDRKIIKLGQDDLALNTVAQRVNASKPIYQCPISLEPKDNKYSSKIADFALEKHKPGSLTLIIVNRVGRAQEIYQKLAETSKVNNVYLIHSRFRPADRKNMEDALKGNGDRIVVSTQAVEAGVDCSARVLITELAPWSSLVQRFGRCNRKGEYNDAEIYWIDFNEGGDEDLYLPYSEAELKIAREKLKGLRDAGISELGNIELSEPEEVRFVIRSKDIIELFDTTPDISGRFIDVTRFIREQKDAEVQVFWRENVEELLKGADSESHKKIKPLSAELCRVSVRQFRDFIRKLTKKGAYGGVYYWNYVDGMWERASEDNIYPGNIYLLDSNAGGYDERLGWTGEVSASVTPIPIPPQEIKNESNDDDPGCGSKNWVLLSEHLIETHRVSKELLAEIQKILPGFLNGEDIKSIENAALFHDLGKAHPIFQNAIKNCDNVPDKTAFYAKSPNKSIKYERRYFRHELGSAIAWLMMKDDNGGALANLTAYLIAAHHGKVRLSIRSMPDEKPSQGEVRIARGIQDGDVIPSVSINGYQTPELKLDLSYMEIGFDEKRGESWISRMTRLRDEVGIFKLAYLETLVRAADARGSMNANKSNQNQI